LRFAEDFGLGAFALMPLTPAIEEQQVMIGERDFAGAAAQARQR
jgi:hypothetical protein